MISTYGKKRKKTPNLLESGLASRTIFVIDGRTSCTSIVDLAFRRANIIVSELNDDVVSLFDLGRECLESVLIGVRSR